MTEIYDVIILIIASLISGIMVHLYDKNHDGKIEKEEILEKLLDELQTDENKK